MSEAATAAAVDSGWPDEDERATLPGWRRSKAEAAVPEPEAAVPEPEAAVPEPEAAVPEPEATMPEPEAASQPLVPMPTVKVESVADEHARRIAQWPTLEITHIDDDDGEFDSEEAFGASSVSAQVVPIKTRRKRKRRAKKPLPEVAEEVAETGDVSEHVAATRSDGSGVHWVLFAVAASVALWISMRAKPEQAKLEPLAAQQPVAAQQQKPEPVAAEEPKAIEPAPAQEAKVVEPVAEEAKAIEPSAMPAAPAPNLVASDAEPARLTAYKTVMASTKSAEGCRYRGDSSGKVSVVVEFGSDGRVQRTDAKGTFANPMTRQCIVSKFSTLSIPTTLPTPIIITADLTLR
jgi:hypothetical protein